MKITIDSNARPLNTVGPGMYSLEFQNDHAPVILVDHLNEFVIWPNDNVRVTPISQRTDGSRVVPITSFTITK